MEEICKCPKCGQSVTENKFSYNCECGLKISKEMWGVDITPEIVKQICAGEPTEVFEFNRDSDSWKAQLQYDKSLEKIVYKYQESHDKKKVIGECPKCGKNIIDTGKYYICEGYKETCNLIINHEILGAKITEDDVKKLLQGEIIRKEFTWKSGKTGEAGLKLNNDKNGTDFVF